MELGVHEGRVEKNLRFVNVYSSHANRRMKYAVCKKLLRWCEAKRLENWSWGHIIQYLTNRFGNPVVIVFD